MTRTKLFQIRLAATSALLLLAFLALRFLWFPDAYFALSGVARLLSVLIGVNIVVGPILSTLVFKPGKRGLKFDLVVLASIEIAILAWGLTEIYDRRPVFVVFAVDRFEAVTLGEIDSSILGDGQFAATGGYFPQLVYAELPADAEVMNQLIDETVFLGMRDIERRPEFWKPYVQGIGVLKSAAIPLSELLTANDSRSRALQRWLDRNDLRANDYRYLPIEGSGADGVVILHADIAYPVDVLAIDPWPDATQ